MYSVDAFGAMINDEVRMDAYATALRRATTGGATVLDIGTGTGIFAMLACRFGAEHVYAVEPNDAIAVARAIAQANGRRERVTFLHGLSTRITLPNRVQVVVSDLRGILPLHRDHIPSIVDARERHLVRGGTLIPRQDTIWVNLVSAADRYQRCVKPWTDNPYGLDMGAARPIVTNTWDVTDEITPGQFLTDPQVWAVLDYRTITNPNVSNELTWSMDRSGVGHGFCVWFDTILFDVVGFSTAPGRTKTVYHNALFPWTAPVALEPGDRVSISLRANLVSGDYVWQWDTRISSRGDTGHVKAHYKQSTFYGVPLSPDQLRKTGSGYLPTLNEDGQIHQFILHKMDGATPLGDIAKELVDRFPMRFPNWPHAMARVGELSRKYSLD